MSQYPAPVVRPNVDSYSRPTDPLLAYTEDEWRAMAARKGLRHFSRRMVPGYTWGPHLGVLVPKLEEAVRSAGARVILTMPPRHSKSLHVSENLPAWYLGNFPDNRIILACHTQELASTFSRRIRNKLNHPLWPFEGVAVADDKASVKAWDIGGHQGGLYAVGVGGSPTGHGANLIIIDDPIKNAQAADSQTFRDELWEWYTGTIRTRLEPGGVIIVTATRWHEDDLTGRLILEQSKGGEVWEEVHMPAVSDEGQPLWPERWPVEELAKVKQGTSERVWAAQYQGKPVLGSGGLLARGYWKRYKELPKLAKAEILVDSAFKTGVHNDFTVFALWARGVDGDAYLVWRWREKVEFPALIRLGHKVHQRAEEMLPGMKIPLVVEDKASGQSAIQTWRQPLPLADGTHLPKLPVIAYPVPANLSKISRAEGVSGYVEGGKAHIPAEAPWLEEWLAEHERFPLGAHDDQVDTSVMGLERLCKPRTVVDIR